MISYISRHNNIDKLWSHIQQLKKYKELNIKQTE